MLLNASFVKSTFFGLRTSYAFSSVLVITFTEGIFLADFQTVSFAFGITMRQLELSMLRAFNILTICLVLGTSKFKSSITTNSLSLAFADNAV